MGIGWTLLIGICFCAPARTEHDAALFTNACIRPFGASETFGTNYQSFLKNVIQSMKEALNQEDLTSSYKRN